MSRPRSLRGLEPDALVIGAGPAGTIAALALARAGARVRLIDRARFPRGKLCGDTVNPGTLAMLDRIGPGAEVRARALPVGGMTVTGAGARVSAAYGGGLHGASLTRRELDLLLLQAAVAAGVHFDDGISAIEPVMAPGGERVAGALVASAGRPASLHARIVIAADGRASRMASRLRLSRFASSPRRWAFGAYYGDVAGLTAFGEMHVRTFGYIGVAPLPGGVANVCVVHAAQPGAGAPRIDQRQAIAEAIAADAELRDRFVQAHRLSEITVLGPLAVNARASGCPGLLLAGDAAGFIDPMTGDGLRFALRGGELAAQAALRELESGVPAHTALHEARRREFTGKWRLNRGLRTLVGSPRAVDLAARLAKHWSTPIEYLVALAGDTHLARPQACGMTESA